MSILLRKSSRWPDAASTLRALVVGGLALSLTLNVACSGSTETEKKDAASDDVVDTVEADVVSDDAGVDG